MFMKREKTQKENQMPENDSEYVFVYTRQQAIKDGIFKDVSEVAREAGIKFPVAITTNLYNTHIIPSEKAKELGQDEQGRLWDVLQMFRLKASSTKDSFMEFEVLFQDHPNKHTKVKIWAVCEAQSPTDPSPAINVMLPEDY